MTSAQSGELVRKLRTTAMGSGYQPRVDMLMEAAARIEYLEREREALRDAIQLFVDNARRYGGTGLDRLIDAGRIALSPATEGEVAK